MCGIAGILDRTRPPSAEELAGAIESLHARGPDHHRSVALGQAALGYTRLAIIDLSAEANQPMADAGGHLWAVFNGEIYNFRELRRELETQGAHFRTRGDTEVVLEAYRAWGPACVERFNGMFAFAVWDAGNETLFLARDRLGEKPLYYAFAPGGRFVFASDLNALRRIPGVGGTVNPGAIGQFLTLGYLLTDCCIFEGVSKLGAGHRLILRPGRGPVVQRYWDLAAAFRAKARHRSDAEAAEALEALIEDAVRLRLVGDVPLGVFLSGGLDSSIVTRAFSRLSNDSPPRTFTIDFRQRGFSEAEQARAVSVRFRTEHHEEIVDLDEAVDALPKAVAAAGEPFADTSMIPTYCMARLARRHATFCLSGDGGDELFAGYETYRADRLRHLSAWMPRGGVRALAAVADRVLPPTYGKVGIDYKIKQFLHGHTLPEDQAHHFWRVVFGRRQRTDLMLGPAPAAADDATWATCAAYAAEVADCHYLDRAMYMDIKTWLVDDILVKVDRMSMAHSLEVRPPLLDHRLVEFAASLPVGLKLRGFTRKYLLTKAYRATMPPQVIHGKKRGFNAPVSRWLREGRADLGRDVTVHGPLTAWLDARKVDALWREHLTGRRDHGFRLFTLTCLGLWLNSAG